MMNKNKAIRAIAAANFQQLIPAYIVTAVFFAVGIYNLIASLTGAIDKHYVDMANYLYVFAVIAPAIVASRNFKRIMHLNGSKRSFYLGCLLTYCISAAAISLIDIVMYLLAHAAFGESLIIWNLVDIFGWWKHGVAVAFVQQFFFLLLVEIFIHTLTSIQTHWYGWVADCIIATVLLIFIPVPALRSLLVGFFNLIIFNQTALLQIVSCLILSAVIYALYLRILQRKKI